METSALELFRCEKFACRLTRKACAARQVKTWFRAYRRQTTAKAKPGQRLVKTGAVHEFCASGECAQGRETAALFPELVAQRPSEPTRRAPRLDLVRAAEEETMARKCSVSGCGAVLREHNRTGICGPCQAKGRRPGEVAKPKLPAPPKAATPSRPPLLKIANDVDALLGRREELLAEIAMVEGQIKGLVAAEEEKLRRMRQAVAGLVKNAAEALPKVEAA